MSRLLLSCATLAFVASTGCGSDSTTTDPPEETGRLTVELQLPPSPDPYADVATYVATVNAGATVVAQQTFTPGQEISFTGLEAATGLTFSLQGRDSSDAVISNGLTDPFDLSESFGTTVPLYFSRTNTFSDVDGAPPVRNAAAVAGLSDGRVLIAGGRVGGTAVASADIYDPVTNAVTPLAAMNAPHADTLAVVVAPDIILIAGGTDAAGAATSAVDLFVYDPGSGTGTWETIPAMSTARFAHAVIAIANNRVLVAGGDDGGGPLDTSEVFTWDGAVGSWQTGPTLGDQRSYPFGFSLAADSAFIGGGFTAGGGANAYSNTADYYTYDGGGGSIASAGTLAARRGYAEATVLSDGSVLIAGGREGSQDTAVDTSERLTANSGQLTSVAGPTLPTPRAGARGGALADGRTLLFGGLTGNLPGVATSDTVFYDEGLNAFFSFSTSPGVTVGGTAVPLPDGTTIVVVDGRVTRFNP